MTRITIVTDAWYPQINGVVRSIENTNRELARMGVEVSMITPQGFSSIPCPTYPEIRLSVATYASVARAIEAFGPCSVHIATEGPLGLLARRWCLKNNMPFSTSYHTRFPEYVAARFPIPIRWLRAFVRWFHNAGNGCMVATASLERELSKLGLRNLRRWSRGIDQSLFRPMPQEAEPFGLQRPIFLTVSRLAVEKNISAFLSLDLPGSKVVVGDGPERAILSDNFPMFIYRHENRRGSGAGLCAGRCLCLPLPDRYLRQYHSGGACQRRASGSLSGDRADRYRRRWQRRRRTR